MKGFKLLAAAALFTATFGLAGISMAQMHILDSTFVIHHSATNVEYHGKSVHIPPANRGTKGSVVYYLIDEAKRIIVGPGGQLINITDLKKVDDRFYQGVDGEKVTNNPEMDLGRPSDTLKAGLVGTFPLDTPISGLVHIIL